MNWQGTRFCHWLCLPQQVVVENSYRAPATSNTEAQVDVCILGGTLGIFLGVALQLRGWKVCVVERNQLVGRQQEWNVTKSDMKVMQ